MNDPEKQPPSVFFGRVVSRDVLGYVDGATERSVSREKHISIAAAAVVSPYVVDLKSSRAAFAAEAAAPQGPDFEQRMHLWAHRLKTVFMADEERDLRRMAPSRRLIQPKKTAPERVERPVVAAPVRQVTTPILPSFAPVSAPMKSGPSLEEKVRQLSALFPAKKKPTPTITAMAPVPEAAAPSFRRFVLPIDAFRRLGAFAAIIVLVCLPVYGIATYAGLSGRQDAIVAGVDQAVEDLRSAGASAVELSPEAGERFNRSAESFAETRSRLRDATLVLAAIVTGRDEQLKSGDRLLSAGESLARAGAEISAAFEALSEEKDASVTDRLAGLNEALTAALPHLREASEGLAGIEPSSLPKEHREKFTAMRNDLGSVLGSTERFLASSDAVMGLLGSEGKRRYLVLFQNDRELRPTGGFIGSYALMDVEGGRVVNLEIPGGGSYDLRGGLNERVAAPDQLRLVNPRWEFQDANWFADFPTSAKTLTWFYEKSGGPSIDGVVAVTTNLMESLLTVTGPIEMAEYGRTIGAANFFDETQRAVEIDYDREENKPKQFIADMAPKMMQQLVDRIGHEPLTLASAVGEALTRKNLLVWFRDQDEQAAASSFGWTGELNPVDDADFLSVVDTNIAGGKTDDVIAVDIGHETRIEEDGSMIDTVTIRRTHNGKKDDLFKGVKNIDFMRVYVPEGSALISAEGFEAPADSYFIPADETLKTSSLLTAIEGRSMTHEASGTRVSSESGLTVFGNWVQVEPGESRAVRLSYRLPFRFQDLTTSPESRSDRLKDFFGAYVPTATSKLVVRKQPGAVNRTFSSTITSPAGWSVRSRIPTEATVADGGVRYSAALDADVYLGMVLTKNE
jgi:hypothetical protein